MNVFNKMDRRNFLITSGLAAVGAASTSLLGEKMAQSAEPPSAIPTLKPGEVPKTWQELGLMQGAPPPKGRLITKQNAWDHPFNRWTFQNMRSLYPSVALDRGEAPPRPFTNNLQLDRFDNIPVKNIQDQPSTLVKVLERDLYTDGIVVLKGDRVVYQRFWNGMTPRTLHWSMSVGKTITGTLAGILINRGEINPSRTIGAYLPELKESGYGNATVDQVLDMLVDIEMDESPASLANPNSPYNRYLGAQGFRPSGEVSSAYRYLPTMRAKGEPGKKYHYVTPCTDVIGWLMERVANKTFAQLFSDEVWSKVGAENEAYYLLDPEGHALAAGGFNSTTRDLARWGLLFLQNGAIGSTQVFPAAVVADIRNSDKYHRQMWLAGGMGGFLPEGAQRKYWYKTNNKDGSFLGVGVFGNHLYVNPAANVVIAKHASFPVSSTPALQLTSIRVMDAIANELK